MEININNYEVYVIDYLDNRLNPVEIAELLLFLENHPELKEELETLKSVTVTPPTGEEFGFKELLIQPADKDAKLLNTENYSHYFIALLEGDLSETGVDQVYRFLKEHPELDSELRLYASCKLQPDKKVKYPGISELQVKPKRAYLSYYLASGIAASILLMITLYLRLTPVTDDSLDRTIRNSVEQQSIEIENPTIIPAEKKEPVKPAENKSQVKSAEEKQLPVKMNKPSRIKQVRTVEKPLEKLDKKPMVINTTDLMAENSNRNFYSNLYDDIRLSQELALATAEEKDQQIETNTEEKIRGVKAGRILNSVISSGEQLAEQIPASMNGWLMADLGIKGFNLLTNNNYSLNRSYNSKGAIKSLRVEEEKKL